MTSVWNLNFTPSMKRGTGIKIKLKKSSTEYNRSVLLFYWSVLEDHQRSYPQTTRQYRKFTTFASLLNTMSKHDQRPGRCYLFSVSKILDIVIFRFNAFSPLIAGAENHGIRYPHSHSGASYSTHPSTTGHIGLCADRHRENGCFLTSHHPIIT